MSHFLFVDSSTSVQVYPKWDYQESDRLIESQHRTRGGSLFRYNWGSYREFNFGVHFVNSSDAYLINNWWSNNTELLYTNDSGVQVFSVMLINKSKPLDKRVKPYEEYYSGQINLSTY